MQLFFGLRIASAFGPGRVGFTWSVDIIPGKGLALNGAFGLASTTQLQIGFWLNFGQICEREAPSAVAWVQDYT